MYSVSKAVDHINYRIDEILESVTGQPYMLRSLLYSKFFSSQFFAIAFHRDPECLEPIKWDLLPGYLSYKWPLVFSHEDLP